LFDDSHSSLLVVASAGDQPNAAKVPDRLEIPRAAARRIAKVRIEGPRQLAPMVTRKTAGGTGRRINDPAIGYNRWPGLR
jgi:hypothetical protein